MLRQWWAENWEDIRYAHKSVWLSMAVFILTSCYATWYIADYMWSSRVAEKEAIIRNLNAEIAVLKKQNEKPKAIQPKAENVLPKKNGTADDEYNPTLDALGQMKDDVKYKLYNEGVIK